MKDESIWKMFDGIAPSYDQVNRILSMGRDQLWRQRMAQYLPNQKNLHLLNVATGTGDVIFSLLQHSDRIEQAAGVDMSMRMLDLAEHKSETLGLKNTRWYPGNALALPFSEDQFHVATMAFGIRNMSDPQCVLDEIHRVLRPSGRALILEFSLPERFWIRWPYLFYLRHVIPFVGGYFSEDTQAYRYLNKSIESFAQPQKMIQWMKQAGFENVQCVTLNLGTVALYIGDCSP